MTVSELQELAEPPCPFGPATQTVLDLIADWQLMRDRLMGFRDGDLHKDISEQAGDTLGDLRLEP